MFLRALALYDTVHQCVHVHIRLFHSQKFRLVFENKKTCKSMSEGGKNTIGRKYVHVKEMVVLRRK